MDVWKPQNRDVPVTDAYAIAILQRISWGAGGPDRDDVISACNKAIAALLKASLAARRKTNADKYIRNATDEELAHLIAGDWCELINCPDLVCEGQCEERILAWLMEDLDSTPQKEEKHEIGEQGAGMAEGGGAG